MFSHSPARQYESLKSFRGPQFPRGSILAAFLNLCFKNELSEIYKAQAFHYKKALNVLNSLPRGTSSIEHVTHRVWLSRDGQEPPEWATNFYISSVEKHPELEHVLWCQNKANLRSTIEKLSGSSVRITVREVGEIRDQMKGVEMYDSLMRQGYFVMACDVLRLEVLRLFGGLYTDYGYELKTNITSLLDRFDIITNQFVNPSNPLDTHCDTNILAAKKGNQIIERFLSFMTNFEMARLMKEKICEVFKRNHGLCNPWTHGPYFSTFLYSTITPQENLLVLSGRDEVLEKKHMGTWWAGTLGNKSIQRDGYPTI
jgi:mannosyltransferase OCH1-like enzyme